MCLMAKPIVFSGIQPTGNLHIGNYLGAIKPLVELQNSGEYDVYYFIADLHSLTGNMDATERKEKILHIAAELIACGIDPKKTTLFVQSHVEGHAELAWIFNTVTPVAELERMTQFKDKSSDQQKKNVNVGLFTYPVLQAADILLYHGTRIPVGEDQKQHVELTRNIARWFNNRYGEYFSEPEVLLTETPRIKSLLEPTKKMSKSKGANHVIELADAPAVLEKKIKKAVTASEGGGSSVGVENLLLLLSYFGSVDDHKRFVEEEKSGSIKYGELKETLSVSIGSYFASFREKRDELMQDHNALAAILVDGAKKAQAAASDTIEEVRRLVGIR